MKDKLYNPKNPGYAAICDVDSTEGALDFILMRLRALNIPVSLEEMGDAFCQRITVKVKSELILHGFARLDACKPHADSFHAVYTNALRIEGGLIAAGMFTRYVKTPVQTAKIPVQRLAAHGDGSRRGGDDSRRSGTRHWVKGQFCLFSVGIALGLRGSL